MGYKLAGYDVIGCNEIDPRMMKVYVQNHHPKYSFLAPIQEFKNMDLPEELFHLDVLDGSPPCFGAGTLVFTSNGYKPIEEVKVGDMVLTHNNRFRKVTELFVHDAKEYYNLKVSNAVNIKVTPNHPFYVKEMVRKDVARHFSAPQWKAVKDLSIVRNPSGDIKRQDYIGAPINTLSILPEWHGVAVEEDGYLWIPFREKELVKSSIKVYNFSVEEDESYTVHNLICHNCSSFSMAGAREDGWGVEKKFREGQAEQVLDTLFFDFIDIANRLQPKVVVAENVKGLLLGEAKDYVRKIYDEFDKAGYYCQHWLLCGADMGVPQRRERVFFVCLRKDLAEPFLYWANIFDQKPKLTMEFNEEPILFGEIADYSGREITGEKTRKLWEMREYGDINQSKANMKLCGVNGNFGQSYAYLDKVAPTLTAKEDSILHFEKPHFLGKSEVCAISSFPQDYDFMGQLPHYICGMSVPPVMMANVAANIYEQWLSKIKI